MIPLTAYFIWLGGELPWMHALSVRSALRNGGFEKVVLYHDCPLSGAGLASIPPDDRLELRLLDWDALAGKLPQSLRSVTDVAAALKAPGAKTNVLRAMLLAAEGGVYLDMDFITLRPFTTLCRDAAVFFGLEVVAFPAHVVQGRNLPRKALAYAHTAIRDVFRRLPSGWRMFRRLEPFYPLAANGAILGSEAGHPFVLEMLRKMLAIDRARLRASYALGTHLLQAVARETWPAGVVRCPPTAFYPFGPEISEHWFRLLRRPPRLDEVLSGETIGVHWYASVRTRRLTAEIDEPYVRKHRKDQLFSALVARALGT